MQKISYSEVKRLYGIDEHGLLAYLEQGKLKAYRRNPGIPHFDYPSMKDPAHRQIKSRPVCPSCGLIQDTDREFEQDRPKCQECGIALKKGHGALALQCPECGDWVVDRDGKDHRRKCDYKFPEIQPIGMECEAKYIEVSDVSINASEPGAVNDLYFLEADIKALTETSEDLRATVSSEAIEPLRDLIGPDTKWEDITLTMLDDHKRVQVKTPAGAKLFQYYDLGFQNKRTGTENRLWEFLVKLCSGYGFKKWDDHLKKDASRCNLYMQEIFGIKDSIYKGHYRKQRRYVPKFIPGYRNEENLSTSFPDISYEELVEKGKM